MDAQLLCSIENEDELAIAAHSVGSHSKVAEIHRKMNRYIDR